MSIRDEARERPTIALAREIASWDQDNPGTGRIPHWAVNLAAHLIDKGYEQADREPSDAEVEAAANAIVEASFGQELPEAPIDLARAALLAAQGVRRAD